MANRKNATVTLNCQLCSKEFKRWPHEVERSKFCSSTCRSRHTRQSKLGPEASSWRGGKVSRTCEFCKKAFEIFPSRLKRGRSRFCSKQCHIGHQKTLVGELSNQWKGGTWHKGYPTSFNKRIREEIRKRDNYTCQGCGVVEADIVKKFGRKLAVHHIDHKRDNLDYVNLITVCYDCNNQANKNRDYWVVFYTNNLKFRGITN